MCGGETSSAQQEQHDMIQGMVQSSFSSPAGAVEVQSVHAVISSLQRQQCLPFGESAQRKKTWTLIRAESDDHGREITQTRGREKKDGATTTTCGGSKHTAGVIKVHPLGRRNMINAKTLWLIKSILSTLNFLLWLRGSLSLVFFNLTQLLSGA